MAMSVKEFETRGQDERERSGAKVSDEGELE